MRDFYNYTTLIDWIFIDVLAILHSICFLLAHRRIMKGRKDVIFVYALCRWSPTFKYKMPQEIAIESEALSSTTISCRS